VSSGPATWPPKPRPSWAVNWVGLCLAQSPDDGITICGLPSGGRAPERALPAIGVVQVLKDRQFPAHIKHRNTMLWTQREDDPDANAARENLGSPDRCLIEERLTRDLQHTNPPGHRVR
jgi:hypothetical protein